MKLVEIFNSDIPYKWIKQDPWEQKAVFRIFDHEYVVIFIHYPADDVLPDGWDISFMLRGTKDTQYEGKIGLEQTGNELLVFGTVLSIIKDWFNHIQPKCITMGFEPKRKSLYLKLTKQIVPDWDIQSPKPDVIVALSN